MRTTAGTYAWSLPDSDEMAGDGADVIFGAFDRLDGLLTNGLRGVRITDGTRTFAITAVSGGLSINGGLATAGLAVSGVTTLSGDLTVVGNTSVNALTTGAISFKAGQYRIYVPSGNLEIVRPSGALVPVVAADATANNQLATLGQLKNSTSGVRPIGVHWPSAQTVPVNISAVSSGVSYSAHTYGIGTKDASHDYFIWRVDNAVTYSIKATPARAATPPQARAKRTSEALDIVLDTPVIIIDGDEALDLDRMVENSGPVLYDPSGQIREKMLNQEAAIATLWAAVQSLNREIENLKTRTP